ncbi:hypothetical protein BT63DRAFT_423841 [Microthyrium microscopicum]|uniref:C2H2-type domain-containing protein n=1 Tax=Microthyrium microscopicum TaxID=703497 RepID=A0A6A6UE85_9PEZI|nr:hypothetical protein BT63DRAFT_423841 [Microthyrium microscopicum]
MKWCGPQKCHRQDCSSKATFKTRSALNTHVRNIHTKPLVCTYPGCLLQKPFGKQCDLKRHRTTMHGGLAEYECLDVGCRRTFVRRDKMLKHAREEHELYKCSLNHCTKIVFDAEKQKHMQECHGSYECGMYSCLQGSTSRFKRKTLETHLRSAHQNKAGLESSAEYTWLRLRKHGDVFTATMYHTESVLGPPDAWKQLYNPTDCSHCEAKISENL